MLAQVGAQHHRSVQQARGLAGPGQGHQVAAWAEPVHRPASSSTAVVANLFMVISCLPVRFDGLRMDWPPLAVMSIERARVARERVAAKLGGVPGAARSGN